MTAAHARQSPAPTTARPRKIVRRTRGNRHGPITRLMSPGDLGQLLKPFVFLDLFDMDTASLAMLRAGEQQLSEIQCRLQNEGRL